MALRLAVICVALVGLAACGSDPAPMLMLPDASATDSGTSPGTDSGTGTDSGPVSTCPPDEGTLPTGMICAASTLSCLMAATTADAQQACITADPMATACLGCINGEIIASCAMNGGCDDELGLVGCCVEEACAATPTEACANAATAMGGACVTEVNALLTCTNAGQMARTCGVSALCFMAASGFVHDFRPAAYINYSIDASTFRLYSSAR